MNGRKAKALRREARQQTIGQPPRKYVTVSRKHTPNTSIELGECTRRRYKQLKAAAVGDNQ